MLYVNPFRGSLVSAAATSPKVLAALAWMLTASSSFAAAATQSAQPDRSIWLPPNDISVDGWRSDWLFEIVTYMTVALFLLMTGILIAAALKFRSRPGGHAQYDRGDTKKDAMFALVISTIIFVIVDGTLLYKSHKDANEVYWKYPETDPGVVKVQVLAQQWAWNFRYAGADGKFSTPDDIVTFNDFRVPEGKKVLCQITSKDVIHSFFLANCRIKRDANPGEITRMWFETKPNTAGSYELTCAEICGFAHYKMKARFEVMTAKDFAAWETEAANWSRISHDPEKAEQQWGWEWVAQSNN